MGFSKQEYWSGVPLPEPVSIIYSLLAKFSVFLFSQDKILIEFGVLISGDSVYSIHLLMQEMLVRPLGSQDPQEKEIALGKIGRAHV